MVLGAFLSGLVLGFFAFAVVLLVAISYRTRGDA
jgi:hypothetical protein